MIFGEGGEIMTSIVGGDSSTYFCDYHYTNIPTTEALRGVLFGGIASHGASAGFVSAASDNSPSTTSAFIGSRLCFVPHFGLDLPDAFNVLAASNCSLEARVTTLEQTLAAVLSGAAVIPALQVRELGVWGSNNLILTGSGAPAKAPDRAGQLYIDTASGAVYKSTGNAAVSDWKNL